MSSLPPIDGVPHTLPVELGRYRIENPLGSGGMAVVYRAWDPLLNLYRAVKVLDSEAASHPMLRQRFLTEASTLTRLVHPNVLRIYDVGEEDSRCWYAMDLVEEGALQRRIETTGPLPEAEALRIVFLILQALGAAHQCGIIHRDVKPANVLMRADGTVLLGDFGSARQAVNAELTRTGDVLGTIGYMAPEQRADSRGAGPAADLYAVGATLYGLVTGRAPLGLFEGELDSGSLARLRPEVRDVIRAATRYRPEHRPPSARALAVDVARAYDALAGAAGPESASHRWMARFDLLIEAVVPPSAAPSSATPTDPSLRNAYAVPRNASARTASAHAHPPRAAAAPPPAPVAPKRPSWLFAAWTTLRAWVDRWFARGFAPVAERPSALVGVWDGRLADILPLRLEIEALTGDRLTGWAVTTGLKGEVVTRVEGHFDAGSGRFDLDERGDRPDRGRYLGRMHSGTLVGEFHRVTPGSAPMAFSLRVTRAGEASRRRGVPVGGEKK